MQHETKPSHLDLRHAIEGGFKLWDYSPSLSRMLFRATGRDSQRQYLFNVDLLLAGVRTIEISTGLVRLLGVRDLQAREPQYEYEFTPDGKIIASQEFAYINYLDPMCSSIDRDQSEKIPVAVSSLIDPKWGEPV